MSAELSAFAQQPKTVSKATWLAQEEHVTDRITVQNLQVTLTAGPDAWGRIKPQPVLLTVTLSLRQQFDTAADQDALDASTVHYGKLSKAIRSEVGAGTSWSSSHELTQDIFSCVLGVAGNEVLQAVEVVVFYPKASLLGEGAGFTLCRSLQSVSSTVHLRNIRLPCLVGVNDNERLQKQAVVINLWVENVSTSRSDVYTQLETALVQLVTDSSCQTLETLATLTVQHLKKTVLNQAEDVQSAIRLRIEKPLAVPFADAPAVEILRRVDGN